MSDLLSSVICHTIAATSSLVAVNIPSNDALVLLDTSVVPAWTACSCGSPLLHSLLRY